jgi:hypothetical protein
MDVSKLNANTNMRNEQNIFKSRLFCQRPTTNGAKAPAMPVAYFTKIDSAKGSNPHRLRGIGAVGKEKGKWLPVQEKS